MRFQAVWAASVAIVFGAAALAEDAVLVLDASGSMWGQIDGVTKIEIARDAVSGLLDELPEERQLGLIAYGHTREGDCADIETLAGVGASRADIRSAVAALNPKGRTPLSDAVVRAAGELRHTEEKATVILVSDGVETCGRDPCAVGAALEEAGVDFTAHVIGFNVVEPGAREQLACLANETGGRFLTAEDADSLAAALEETVAKEAEEAAAGRFLLQATELVDGPIIDSGLTWRVSVAGGGEEMFRVEEAGPVEVELPVGVYDITVLRASDRLRAEQVLEPLEPDENRVVTLPLLVAMDASLTLFPEGERPAGSDIVVGWDGPEREGDYIRIGHRVDGRFITHASSYVNINNPIALRLPVEPGEYEVEYVLGRPTTVLASEGVSVGEVAATLEAPDTVAPNTEFEVVWTGPEPGTNDFLTVVAPDASDSAYTNYHYSRNGSPASLRSPLEPGAYEIRFVQGGSKVLARRTITVTESGAALEAADVWPANTEITVGWIGPGSRSDFITIVEPDAGERSYATYAYARAGESEVVFSTPLEPGEYELRYVQGGRKILARQPIEITGAEATLGAPEVWPANTEIEIGWTGPATARDFITIVEADAGDSSYVTYGYPKEGEPTLAFTTPLEPGSYELRYVQGGSLILARQPIVVEPVTASLAGPSAVDAGATFQVAFEGPDHHGDFVTIVAPDAGDRAYTSYHYSRQDSPGELTAPEEPGDYELRYVQAGRKVLVRAPITVN